MLNTFTLSVLRESLQEPLQTPKSTDARVPFVKWCTAVNAVSSSYPQMWNLPLQGADCIFFFFQMYLHLLWVHFSLCEVSVQGLPSSLLDFASSSLGLWEFLKIVQIRVPCLLRVLNIFSAFVTNLSLLFMMSSNEPNSLIECHQIVFSYGLCF